MPLEYLSKNRLFGTTCALLAGATLMLAVASTPALAADEENEDWFDVKIMRKVLSGIGLKRDGDAGIDFRERSPLVVPPSRDLPPPDAGASVQNNPAWPVDPDVKRRKDEVAKRKARANTAWEDEARPLSAAEMAKGRKAGGGQQGYSTDPNTEARPYSPSALGAKSAFTWDGMFGKNKEETAAFTGEPTRSTLTQPPPGYQTPSAAQPYGLAPNKGGGKPITLEERMEDKR
jgi:hypothetical protein